MEKHLVVRDSRKNEGFHRGISINVSKALIKLFIAQVFGMLLYEYVLSPRQIFILHL